MNPKESYLLMDIPEKTDSDRVTIRRYVHGDGEAIFALAERNGNREHLSGIADDIAGLKSVEEAEVKARRHGAEWAKRDRFVAGVWDNIDGSFIGELWIEPKNWEVPLFEIGWFIDKGLEGKGLAYESAKLGLSFIFNELKAHKVIAATDDTNTRSFKLAERLGFIKEGHTRESEIRDGKRFGRLLYGILRKEFI
jgi:RimJ/RimL family protein N-acetyltransferase